MRVGVDWISLGIFAVVYGVSQVRTLPIRARYGVFAAGMAAIGIYRLSQGQAGVNAAIAAAALVMAVFYVFRAITARGIGRPSSSLTTASSSRDDNGCNVIR